MSVLGLGLALLSTACVDKGSDSAPESVSAAPLAVLAEAYPSAFLSIWGSSATDVWVVGADNGSGPAMLHYDGSAWTSLVAPSAGDLWWVRGVGGSIYAVGAGGRVLRGDSGGSFTETVVDPTLTLYGVWGAADDDVWVVGGNPDVSSDAGAIWHFDGTGWTEATVPAEISAAVAVFKVWGRATNDVWVVGAGGITAHWDGTIWSLVPAGSSSLFTVAGDSTSLYAVGGFGSAVALRYEGGAWVDESPAFSPQLNGVAVGADGAALAVGNTGAWFRRGDAGWTADTRDPATPLDYHAAWIDSDGGAWAVGGHLSGRPLDGGVLVYDGTASVPEVSP